MSRRSTASELLIRQRARALERNLPGARAGDTEAIHRARVATRRLREALPFVLSGSRGRKVERRVRGLTRVLGPVRELDVAVQTLDELVEAGTIPSAGVPRLKQAIRLERQRLHSAMRHATGQIDLEKLRRRLVRAVRRQHAQPEIERVWDRAARRALRLRDAIESAAGIYLPDRLHEVRIAVKKLRYCLEVTNELTGSRAVARLRTLHQLQRLLGRMHDLEVLIARVRAVQGSSRAPDFRVSADLDRLVRVLEAECRQLHGHYMTQRRRLIAICDFTVERQARARGRAPVSSAA